MSQCARYSLQRVSRPRAPQPAHVARATAPARVPARWSPALVRRARSYLLLFLIVPNRDNCVHRGRGRSRSSRIGPGNGKVRPRLRHSRRLSRTAPMLAATRLVAATGLHCLGLSRRRGVLSRLRGHGVLIRSCGSNARPSWRKMSYRQIMQEYGVTAVVVHTSMWLATLGATYVAILNGWSRPCCSAASSITRFMRARLRCCRCRRQGLDAEVRQHSLRRLLQDQPRGRHSGRRLPGARTPPTQTGRHGSPARP